MVQFTAFLVAFCTLFMGLPVEGKTYWSKSLDNERYRIPAGQEKNIILHVCRITVNKDLIVGKLMTGNGSPPRCNSAYRGDYFGSPEFEVRFNP